MVSFQCDGCTDVVKKPKLDNHYYKCHASFSCVDCSKTFGGPKEWKGHTSCISEAEKYQKGLYKGKKGDPHGRSNPKANGEHAKSSGLAVSHPQAQTHSDVTPTSTEVPSKGQAHEDPASTNADKATTNTSNEKKERKKKRKYEENDVNQALVGGDEAEANEHAVDVEKKTKRGKKGKNKEFKSSETVPDSPEPTEPAQLPDSVPVPLSSSSRPGADAPSSDKRDKKKRKRDNYEGSGAVEPTVSGEVRGGEKKKKKDRKSKDEPLVASETKDKSKSKKRKADETSGDGAIEARMEAAAEADKKKLKKQKLKAGANEERGASGEAEVGAQCEKKKVKKEKLSKILQA